MKNNLYILFLTILIGLFTSCKKEAPLPTEPVVPADPPSVFVPIFEPGDTSKGAAYAKKLTASWIGSVYCKTAFLDSNMLGLKLFTYNSNGSIRECIRLGAISKNKLGLYEFASDIYHIPEGNVFTSYTTWTSDGDVLQDYFHMDSYDIKNQLAITKLDLVNKRVEGIFHASYNIQEPRINPLNPPKVTFSEGRFWATIRE